ncbi:HutD/Ves family protein [Variovorax sp. RHLX14]|uniref:HutD/Ves family protein n=1 Tax=Variovorax sp. RHLX14 TaxID=1259731 RepID=UPI003F456126
MVSWPLYAEPDTFSWRVSIAAITASGPFSDCPGVERTIMLLEGDGIRLQSKEFDEILDVPHRSFSFEGEAPVVCTLHGRSAHTLNLMRRHGHGRADMRVLEHSETLEASAHGLMMCIEGQWRVGGGLLTYGQGVWWTEQDENWEVKPASRGARLAVMQWWPA